MSIRILIVDDEKDARDSLQLLFEQFHGSEIEIIASVSSVKEAVVSIKKNNPDLVFLDIEMPNENGFQLFSYFRENYEFQVVFTTAFQKYAHKAFRYAALDYLLKPVDYRQLRETLDRYEKQLLRITPVNVDTFLNNINTTEEENKKILFPYKDGYHIVKVASIMYCEADINYSTAFTSEDKNFTISRTLKFLEEILPSSLFFRAHKSYLVNLNYVRTFDKKRGLLILENNKSVAVATRRTEELLKALRNK